MAHGTAHLAFANSDGATRQGRTFVRDPLRVLFPRRPEGDLLTAVLVTTSGGLVGGDRLDTEVAVGPDGAVLVTSQAAEKIYRSAGPDCHCDVTLQVAAGAWLEWLPQETILFDGARLRRRIGASVAPGGRLLAGEILVLGRAAMGERLTRGLVRDAWEVVRNGRLTWCDALHLDGDIAAQIDAVAGFDGAVALATLVYAGADAPQRLALARDLLGPPTGPSLRAGFTLVGGVMVGRWLSRDAAALRQSYAGFWAGFRHAAAGLPARLPALWQI